MCLMHLVLMLTAQYQYIAKTFIIHHPTYCVYGITGVTLIALWTTHSIIPSEENISYYADYNLPTAFTNKLFSVRILVLSTIFMTVGGTYLFLIKYNLDVYITLII